VQRPIISFFFLLLLGALQGMTPLAAQQIPHMDRCQGSTQLIVSGRPFIIFGGELGNFAAGTAAQADDILPRVARAWIQASARKALHDPKTVMRTYVPKKNTLAVASVSASFAWDLNRPDRNWLPLLLIFPSLRAISLLPYQLLFIRLRMNLNIIKCRSLFLIRNSLNANFISWAQCYINDPMAGGRVAAYLQSR